VGETLVTVLLISYNHIESFERAIESVLSQKTNFDFKIIILDDASTDGTSELVKKYSHEKNVKCIIREKNLGSTQNLYQGLKLIDTKYYAVLDTDDYWCDDNKLQMQIDILEQNPDCSFCAHNTLVTYADSGKTRIYSEISTRKFGFPSKISRKHYIEPHNSSRVYRTDCLDLAQIKDPVVLTYDIATNFYFLTKGNLYYLENVMSVYDYTNNGFYSGASSYKQRFYSANTIHKLNKEFDYKYNNLLAKFFATRLNLSFVKYFSLKLTNNPEKLDILYQKILDRYSKKYLNNKDRKPILQISLPVNQKTSLVFEIRREKDKV